MKRNSKKKSVKEIPQHKDSVTFSEKSESSKGSVRLTKVTKKLKAKKKTKSTASSQSSSGIATPQHHASTSSQIRSPFAVPSSISRFASFASVPDASRFEGTAQEIRKRPPLLQLPLNVRRKIWNFLPSSKRLQLRTICSRIKIDIDYFIGLPAIINQDTRSFGFFSRVGIRSAKVLNLVESPNGQIKNILLYPNLLVVLEIEGSVSSAYFAYFIEVCPNIREIHIEFSRALLLLLPKFFPSAERDYHLTELRILKITADSRFEHELTCIQENIRGLLRWNLEKVPIREIFVHLTHSVPSPILKSFHQVVAEFINSKSENLVTIAITIKERRTDKSHLGSVSELDDLVADLISKHPSIFDDEEDEPELASIFTTELKDIEFGQIPSLIFEPLFPIFFNSFKKTEKLHLSVNGIHAQAWKNLPLEMSILESVYLDIIIPLGNWDMYRTTIHNCAPTLKKILLIDVDVEGMTRETRRFGPGRRRNLKSTIDVGFLDLCKNLQVLKLLCLPNEAGGISRMRNLHELPKSLTDIQFAWVKLSPLQLVKLLVFHKNLDELQVDYWSRSGGAFRRFLCLLSFIFRFKLTKVRQIKIVDTKIVFQTGRNLVDKTLETLAPAASVVENRETVLSIDTLQYPGFHKNKS